MSIRGVINTFGTGQNYSLIAEAKHTAYIKESLYSEAKRKKNHIKEYGGLFYYPLS